MADHNHSDDETSSLLRLGLDDDLYETKPVVHQSR
jgi:hypothetical protein